MSVCDGKLLGMLIASMGEVKGKIKEFNVSIDGSIGETEVGVIIMSICGTEGTFAMLAVNVDGGAGYNGYRIVDVCCENGWGWRK